MHRHSRVPPYLAYCGPCLPRLALIERIIWSHKFTWSHSSILYFVDCKHRKNNGQEPFQSQLLTHAECLTHVRCFAPVANMISHEVQQQKQLRNTWVTHCTTLSAGLVPVWWVWRFGVALMRRKMVEMLMPRSSVRSMRTTSPAGRSSEKLVKTQGVPGRNSAICCGVSVAFKCRVPLDMRRLPCHGPGLRKLSDESMSNSNQLQYTDTLVIVLRDVIISCCTVSVPGRCSW